MNKHERALLIEWKKYPCFFCGEIVEDFVLYGINATMNFPRTNKLIKMCPRCENDWIATSQR